MAAYILLTLILLILALLIFTENRETKPPRTGKSPEELKLEEIKRADAERRLKEEAKRAKEESRRRLEASKKAEEEEKAAREEAQKAEAQEQQRKAEAAQRKAEEEKRRREEQKAKRRQAEEEAAKKEAEAAAKEKEEALKAEEAKKRAQAEKEAAEAEEAKSADVELPDYPAFDHSRLVEMGLSNEEATDFVKELIPQIETQMPLIDEAIAAEDFHQMERLIHSIKGSATNIGTGGVSDLLVEYNTYLKSGKSLLLAQAYQEELVRQLEKLKAQYL